MCPKNAYGYNKTLAYTMESLSKHHCTIEAVANTRNSIRGVAQMQFKWDISY